MPPEQPVASTMPVPAALKAGRERWGPEWRPSLQASAPGRVELLGNHIDYNGGPVLAAAIDRRAVVLGDTGGEAAGAVEICFADTSQTAEFDPSALTDWRNQTSSQAPADYARGVVAALIDRSLHVRSGRLSVSSAVPAGIGVSSSAALCLALSLTLSDRSLDQRDLILIAQEAEHRAGTPCGTMDQSASVAGGVILFDGAALTYKTLQPNLGEMAFLVIDSGVHRSLSHSSYPVRVDECSKARVMLQEHLGQPVEHLAQVSAPELDRLIANPPQSYDETLLRRVRHVINETARVHEGVAALERSDWIRFGALMIESGRSSAGDYEISHPVVEELVARLLTDPGVVGARMMGGGEGGSLIALVHQGASEAVRERITDLVNKVLPDNAPRREVFAFTFADGASIRPFDQ